LETHEIVAAGDGFGGERFMAGGERGVVNDDFFLLQPEGLGGLVDPQLNGDGAFEVVLFGIEGEFRFVGEGLDLLDFREAKFGGLIRAEGE
jgi:hypothetical protein